MVFASINRPWGCLTSLIGQESVFQCDMAVSTLYTVNTFIFLTWIKHIYNILLSCEVRNIFHLFVLLNFACDVYLKLGERCLPKSMQNIKNREIVLQAMQWMLDCCVIFILLHGSREPWFSTTWKDMVRRRNVISFSMINHRQ